MPLRCPGIVALMLLGGPILAKESAPPARLAVLDFATEAESSWLGSGFAATLAARLELLPQLRVADLWETRAGASGLQVVATDDALVQSLGRQLSVDWVITGRLLREPPNLMVTAWLVSVLTGRRQFEQKLSGSLDSLFSMQFQLLTGWWRTLRVKLSKEEEAQVSNYLPTESLQAFEFFGRGLVQYHPDRPLEALGIWEQAVEFDPHFALALEARGRAAFRYQEILYEQALQQYRQALAISPGNARLHYLLGLAYSSRGKYDDALRELQEALRLKPNMIEAHYQLGSLYLSALRRPNEAIQSFSALLALEPTHVRALNNLGAALWQKGRRDEALAAWQEVLRYDPHNPFAQENLKRFGG